MGFGALAVKSGGGSEPKFMKLSKRSKKTVIHCYIVMVLAFGMVLAGCTDRESEFLAEIRETETPVPDENPESGTEASGNSERLTIRRDRRLRRQKVREVRSRFLRQGRGAGEACRDLCGRLRRCRETGSFPPGRGKPGISGN